MMFVSVRVRFERVNKAREKGCVAKGTAVVERVQGGLGELRCGHR